MGGPAGVIVFCDMTTSDKKKNILVAFLLGLLLPGLGLLYAAPWLVAGVASVFAIMAYKMFAWIPLIGSVLMGLMALCSALLSVTYARGFNRHGKRVPVAVASEAC